MYRCDSSLSVHFYTNDSGLAGGLAITQFRPHKTGKSYLEVPIVYDSFTFTGTQRKYTTYKRVCAFIKFVNNYDYLCRYPKNSIIFHTDHKPLTYYLKSDENIYGHWADRLRSLHILVQYIPRQRNRVADGLSRTLFWNKNCKTDPEIEEVAATLSWKGPRWI